MGTSSFQAGRAGTKCRPGCTCPDETTSHPTRLSKDDNQVGGYELV